MTNILNRIAVCLGVLTVLGGVQASADESKQEDRPLNVLMIVVDDLRVELGCYGDTIVKSPNIDRLARRGVQFNRAYCQQALCNASRASAMTGLRPDTVGVTDLYKHFRQTHPDIVTLPQCFMNAGYHARGIGKVFHNWHQPDFRGDALSWSVPAVMHYSTHGDDVAQVTGDLPPNLSDTARTECRDVPDEAYFDGRIANLAVEALEELRDQPFFLAVGFWKPHLPFNAPKKYWDLYPREAVALPENPDPPTGVPEIALHNGQELMRDFKNGLTPEQVITLRHGYYAAVSYLDAQVGKVVDALDRLGLADRTVICFWSDHGFHLGEHGLWCKTSNFELDARVPMFLAAPGMATAGQKSNAIVEMLDLYPTLLDLCGLEAPHALEGVSLVPLLDGSADSVKRVAWTQHPRPAYPPGRRDPDAMGYSIRNDGFRYTEWRAIPSGETVATELYDHTVDPRETNNLMANPELSVVSRLLSQWMEDELAKQGSRE